MCTSPLIAVKYGVDKDTGKWKIKLKRNITFCLEDYYKKYGRENVVLLPCGSCAACVLSRRKAWSVRCACEALDHQETCFITLTYDDLHLPTTMDQVKVDLRKFIKSIRNSDIKVRYFGCGEEGSQTSRKHAHVILFGFMPKDLVFVGNSASNEAMFESKFLTNLWKKGLVKVQFFTPRTAAYVAGYVSKKLGSKVGFQVQSTRPGLGFNFYKKHFRELLKYQKVFVNLGVGEGAALPRYFQKLFEAEGYSFYLSELKEERGKLYRALDYKAARDHGFKNIEEGIFYKKNLYENMLLKLERGL